METHSPELKVAIEAAMAAGGILDKYEQGEIERELKEDKSMVTAADTEAEIEIKKIISENFPEHSVIGEETEPIKKNGGYIWYVDPVDGSRNFAHQIPFFAVSIALVREGEVLLGVIYNPATKAIFYAEKGKGAYFNHKRMHVSKSDSTKCIVTVSSGRNKEDLKVRRNLLRDLPENVVSSVRDFGCTALDLAFVARGSTEADIKLGFKTYDVAAGIIIVREAGGKVTGLSGEEWSLLDEGSFIASNGIFHEKLVTEVKKQRQK